MLVLPLPSASAYVMVAHGRAEPVPHVGMLLPLGLTLKVSGAAHAHATRHRDASRARDCMCNKTRGVDDPAKGERKVL
jgi:hypothetical protein